MAALAWAGWLAGGPVLPVVLLGISWSKPDSLARQHAALASSMWLVALLIWVPAFFIGILSQPESPAVWAIVLALGLATATLVTSIVGLVTALRSPVVG